MKLVIQTGLQSPLPLQDSRAVSYLHKVHAVEDAPMLEMGEVRYHYLQIDDNADLAWLIPKLMDVPGIEAAYEKSGDQPAG